MPELSTTVTSERPASLWELFVACTCLAMQGFGGVIAVAQREFCVRRHWLTPAQFLEMLNTAQVLPGANVCNLTGMVGDRFFGWRGAFVALAGMLVLPMAGMLLVAWAIALVPAQSSAQDLIQGALRGITIVAAGQIMGTVLRLAAPLKQHPLKGPTCVALVALAFAMSAFLRWPLIWVLLGLGSASCLLTYATLRRQPPHGGTQGQGS